jgi:hypothetical protein
VIIASLSNNRYSLVMAGSKIAPMTQDKPAKPALQVNARRSSRVTIGIPVVIFGQTHDGKVFREETLTIKVSANGASVILQTDIDSRKPALLLHAKTRAEVQCRVAYVGERTKGQVQVGLEFAAALPKFWSINFPPEDWNPAERKKPVIRTSEKKK